jgi:hypothetical protein
MRELVAHCPLAERTVLLGSTPPLTSASGVAAMRKASQERGFYYHPSRHSAAQPIVAGWAYQWIARLDFAHDGWVAPMDVVRVRAKENANEVAAGQVKGLLRRLPEWCEREEEAPLFVFDAGYPTRCNYSSRGWRDTAHSSSSGCAPGAASMPPIRPRPRRRTGRTLTSSGGRVSSALRPPGAYLPLPQADYFGIDHPSGTPSGAGG